MPEYERVEKEVRCRMCEKLLTKIIVVLLSDKDTLDIQAAGINIRFGTETKCRRCKSINYDLIPF